MNYNNQTKYYSGTAEGNETTGYYAMVKNVYEPNKSGYQFDADASYKGHKEDYNKRVSELNDFRKQHNLPTKDEDSFDDYLEKRAQRYRDVN